MQTQDRQIVNLDNVLGILTQGVTGHLVLLVLVRLLLLLLLLVRLLLLLLLLLAAGCWLLTLSSGKLPERRGFVRPHAYGK